MTFQLEKQKATGNAEGRHKHLYVVSKTQFAENYGFCLNRTNQADLCFHN